MTTTAQSIIAQHMLEKTLQDSICEYAEVRGWRVFHARDSRRQNLAGLPDLILLRDRVIWAELKRHKSGSRGKLSPQQEQVLEDLRNAGQEVYVWRPENWLSGEVEGILT